MPTSDVVKGFRVEGLGFKVVLGRGFLGSGQGRGQQANGMEYTPSVADSF